MRSSTRAARIWRNSRISRSRRSAPSLPASTRCARWAAIAAQSSSDPVAARGDRVDDRGPPVAELGEIQHQLEVAPGLPRSRPVGLVDGEQVGDLEEAGLRGLDGVAPARVEHHDGRVGRGRHLHLLLADPDRLDDDQRDRDRGQQPDRVGDRHRQPPEMPAGGHRTDVDARIERVARHPDTVTEDRSTRKGGRGIDREHAHAVGTLEVGLLRNAHQAVGQGGLARAGRAGDPDRVRVALGGVGDRRDLAGALAAPLHHRQQSGQRTLVAAACGVGERGGIASGGGWHGRSSVPERPRRQSRLTCAPSKASLPSKSS